GPSSNGRRVPYVARFQAVVRFGVMLAQSASALPVLVLPGAAPGVAAPNRYPGNTFPYGRVHQLVRGWNTPTLPFHLSPLMQAPRTGWLHLFHASFQCLDEPSRA